MSVAEFPATYIYEKVDISYELDDEKSCAKPATKIHKVEDLKTAIILKLNNILGKMRETACPVTVRFHTITRVLLKISSITYVMARRKSVKVVLSELRREIYRSFVLSTE